MFAPDNNKVPSPDFVKAVVPSITPPYVKVVPVLVLIVPPSVLNVIPLLVFKVKVAVVCKVPPLKVNWSATADPGAAPKLVSAATEIVPASITILPV